MEGSFFKENTHRPPKDLFKEGQNKILIRLHQHSMMDFNDLKFNADQQKPDEHLDDNEIEKIDNKVRAKLFFLYSISKLITKLDKNLFNFRTKIQTNTRKNGTRPVAQL